MDRRQGSTAAATGRRRPERGILTGLRQRRPRHAPLQQQGMEIGVLVDEARGAVAVPGAQRIGLVLAFPVRIADLEHGRHAVRQVGREGHRLVDVVVRLAEPKVPAMNGGLHESGQVIQPGGTAREMPNVLQAGRNDGHAWPDLRASPSGPTSLVSGGAREPRVRVARRELRSACPGASRTRG